MRTARLFLFLSTLLLAADTPRHVFNTSGALTAATGAPARTVAQDYLRQWAAGSGLTAEDIAGAYVVKEYRTAHNGVTHLVYRQRFQGIDIYNSEWTVNIDRDGRVLNAGGSLAARPTGVSAPDAASRAAALRSAFQVVKAAGSDAESEPVWYRVNGRLRPAWVFYVPDENGVDVYATLVDSETGKVLHKENLTLYQAPQAARGLVFERHSPQPNTTPGAVSPEPRPYVQRTLQSFAGDPAASPLGWVTGTQTSGNNAVAAEDLPGIRFLPGAVPAQAANSDFSFPLELGPGAASPLAFADAATTNLFYWTNRAHDLFYQTGFDEAAGNFQVDNRSRGGVGGDPMYAFSHFGAAANGTAAVNNAFFTSSRVGEDGARSSINMYVGGSRQNGVFSDGSFDAEVIVHEYTHGVSTRLVRRLGGFQGNSMGEGWSDFFALEFLLPDGAPLDGSYPQAEYLFQNFGTGIRTRPYSTNMDVNPLTFAALGHVSSGGPEVHADGEIWMEALWEMRANLIRQHGEKEGRRRVRLLVIDGMKLSPPAPTMVDMRDAILLADRVDFDGASQSQIWEAFAKRGLGALAHAADASSVHILASYEKPSPVASMRFYEEQYVLGEDVRLVLQDANRSDPEARVRFTTSSGDIEELILRRTGSYYMGTIFTSQTLPVSKMDGVLQVVTTDYLSAYYLDPDAGGSWRLMETTVPTQSEYFASVSTAAPPPTAGERALFSSPRTSRVYGLSTRIVLPFEFPFFDKKYKSVWLYSDGLLTFDLPRPTSCTDLYSLASANGIAPMWMDLAFGGGAQKDENVYMTTGPDWVMFRWAGETQPYDNPLFEPSPVNFSAVLYDDGRIRFFYGDGNRDLANSWVSPLLGCSSNAPTVGIANGHDTYVLPSVYHNGNPNLENTLAATFDPPFNAASVPVAIIERPAADERQQGVIRVKGVAWDDAAQVARVDIVVDGVAVARSSATASRADFCATQRVRGCPFVGYSANLNPATLGLKPGPHTLQVRAVNSRGSFVITPEKPLSFQLEDSQGAVAEGAVESPQDGAELAGVVQVKGYAYAPDLRVAAVDLLLDGASYGALTYNQRRDDVCDAISGTKPVNCPNVGFTMNFNTAGGSVPLPNGKHTLQVRVRDEVGRYGLIPAAPLNVTVNNEISQPPKGVLVSPKPNEVLSGTVSISGYAWDPDGRVTSVVLLLDGAQFATLRYGQPRPEECATLGDVAACPNIGFEGDFDTRVVSNGVHTLGIGIVDNKSNTAVVPQFVRYGMNVVFKN